ncbi:hypothetical protein BV25DRAFT_1899775 [Artomyces pyxidatus]|uniref:Uncharacterized protein n=1 Tax=Artomyces pyxidatus TaxID=48021 RepID=A0ACB8T2M7_9AGAM|nr:hypothetical protein BV25DRAFT_1899775 [Artomyces pyxidatus]
MCMLANGGVKPYYASGMAEALSELRQDADTDLAVNATCTNALFHFHAQSWGFLDGPAADTPPDEADLKDVETIWATNVVHDLRGDVDGAIAFVSFTQSVLPRLRSASPETVELVWKTIGYDLDTSGESASNPRSRSWGSSGSFPVGGNSNMKWARRSSWDIEQRRGNGQSFWDPKDRRDIAKLLSSLRRLRTTILAAGFPDPLDADHSIDSLPYPPEMYVKLYNNLRQLYRFLTEFEDLVRASASSAPIESVAGPSTSPPEMTVHPAEPEPANTPHGLDPQRRLAHDEPDVSADEREPAPEIGGDPGA